MTKIEFLSFLRGRITGRIPTSEVESQIDYYSAYIDGRIGAGLTEEEAVAELGDPQLIAKTVIESTDRAAEAAGYDGRYRSSTDTYDDSDGINDGIFGESGRSTYDRGYSGSSYSENSYAGNNYSGNNYAGSNNYTGESAGSRYSGNDAGGQYARGNNGQSGGQQSSGTGMGCIIAVIILVIMMVIGWVLTGFVFRLGIRLLGWLFPVIAVAGVIGLVFSLIRRR